MAFRCAILFAVLVAALPNSLGYSAGAPEGACEDMVPQHHTDPQSSAAPYSIQLSKSRIRAGDAVQVTIRGNSNNDLIKGFMVQARVGDTPVGKFEVEPNNGLIQKMDCGNGKGNSITHKKIAGNGVNSITFRWVAPAQLKETVTFKATIALNGGVFWVGHASQPLTIS